MEVHDDDWWIKKYEAYGFRYNPALTSEIKQVAKEEYGKEFPPNGKKLMPQHILKNMKVFINPVSRRPSLILSESF